MTDDLNDSLLEAMDTFSLKTLFATSPGHQVGPQLVEHDLQDIIDSDPVTLPLTRTGLARLGQTITYIISKTENHNRPAPSIYYVHHEM